MWWPSTSPLCVFVCVESAGGVRSVGPGRERATPNLSSLSSTPHNTRTSRKLWGCAWPPGRAHGWARRPARPGWARAGGPGSSPRPRGADRSGRAAGPGAAGVGPGERRPGVEPLCVCVCAWRARGEVRGLLMGGREREEKVGVLRSRACKHAWGVARPKTGSTRPCGQRRRHGHKHARSGTLASVSAGGGGAARGRGAQTERGGIKPPSAPSFCE